MLMEQNAGGSTVQRMTQSPHGYGNVLILQRGGTTRYAHGDLLGSVRLLTAGGATKTDSYIYDAWGDEVDHTGSSDWNRLKYVGKLGYVSEDATDGYYVRRRYLRTGIGRWLSRDPVEDPGSPHAYVRNDPAEVPWDPGDLGLY